MYPNHTRGDDADRRTLDLGFDDGWLFLREDAPRADEREAVGSHLTDHHSFNHGFMHVFFRNPFDDEISADPVLWITACSVKRRRGHGAKLHGGLHVIFDEFAITPKVSD